MKFECQENYNNEKSLTDFSLINKFQIQSIQFTNLEKCKFNIFNINDVSIKNIDYRKEGLVLKNEQINSIFSVYNVEKFELSSIIFNKLEFKSIQFLNLINITYV